MKLKFEIMILIIFFLFGNKLLFSEESVILDKTLERYSFNRHVKYFEDKDGKLELKDVIKEKDRWLKTTANTFNFGYTSSSYWFKFTVYNIQKSDINWYLDIAYPLLDKVFLYVPQKSGDFLLKKSGDYFPLSEREIKDRDILFSLIEPPGKHTYYFNIRTTSVISFEIVMWNPIANRNYITMEYSMIWIFYGVMIIMVLYNFFIYISVREKSYIYYVILITSFIIIQSVLNGVAYQYLWPNSIWWANNCLPIFISIATFGFLQFFRTYLQTRENYKTIDKITIILIIINMLWIPSIFLNNYRFSIKISMALVFISMFCTIIFATILVVKGSREAWFYLLGFISFVIGVYLFQLRSFGFIRHNFLTNWGIQIGASFMVVLFSIGLADKIKILKDELAELNIDLEQKVMDRTVELEKANEKLLELDKAKNNFFANISHEIRTPLTLIISPIESIIQGDYGDSIGENFFNNILKNGLKLMKLINNLLDFSKIEAGKMDLKIRKVDINKFIKNYINGVQPTASSRNISINFSSVSDDIFIYVDIEKLDKITMNLFSNALKFTDSGGWIDIRISNDENNCYIEYEDTGIGISTDMLEKIFDRFAQADSSSTRKYEGTGIGLSLAKEFVEMHGGNINVTSKCINNHPLDHGTIFKISLPMGKDHFEGRTDIIFFSNSEVEDSISDYRFHGLRELTDLNVDNSADRTYEKEISLEDAGFKPAILIVDDNSDMRAFLSSILEKSYIVHTAVNGEDGLNKLKETEVELIICDVMMPVMDGYEMTKRIREIDEFKRIPIIMLTAKSEIVHKIEGLEHGADDYLVKPFNSKELLTRIKTQIKTYQYEKIISRRNIEIEKDLETARLLQKKLLPPNIFDVPGYLSYIVYIPMDKVGGDFYDFSINSDTIELFIADVSGHGLPGAFLSTITKIAFENISGQKTITSILYYINDIICKYTVNNNYVTTFFCMIDRNSNVMRYCNAGHIPPLVYRRMENEFYSLKAKGKPVGWFKKLQLEEKEFQLKKGDRLILFTDGIVENFNENRIQFGWDNLKKFIRQHIDLPPEKFSHELVSCLKKYSGKDNFDDDVCMIVFDVL